MSESSGRSGTRRRVLLSDDDRAQLRETVERAIAAADGDLQVAAGALRMPLAALQELIADGPTSAKRRFGS